eukprot:TRINITY_DN6301_c0_g1_i1.p1 TRINITY_DN6301_c0_g1~~TRINITY_DN6301_c0_g1_i1.p1  ORF type:complete len:198 (-),score=52.91 TRINITY_DN6301_c0_g1_i1:20-613(-)
MSLVNHPNLVRCYGGQTKNDNYAILSELMEDNLFNLLSKKSVKLEPYHVYKMAIQVCRGMEYLHACNLIHRDLKSVNLLVDNDLNIKVCDFGLSRLIDRERNMTGNVGTVSWIAPEIFQQEHYTEKADVYSFGALLFQMITTKTFPMMFKNLEHAKTKIKSEVSVVEFQELIIDCCKLEPDERPTIEECIDRLKTMS